MLSAQSTIRSRSITADASASALLLALLLATGCASGGGPQPSPTPPADADPRPAPEEAPASAEAGRAGGEAGSSPDPRIQEAEASTELVDRVVAVVGDTTLLYSEVQQEIIRRESQDELRMPQDPAARDSIFRAITEELTDQLILLQGARDAGVEVAADEVERVVDQRFQEIQERFGSAREFRAAVEQTGQNMYQFRQGLEARVRTEMSVQRFMQQNQGELPPAPVTEEEIREEYEETWAGRQGPATVTLRRLQVEPDPDSAALARARARADSALQEIRSGTDFVVAVRRYSEDPGSRTQDGELGWIRRSEVLPSFGDAAWGAPLGRPVGPVRTRHGYHILEVQNSRGGERKVRHVLVTPEIGESDIEAARQRAEAVVDSLRSGADFDRLADEFGDAPANRESEVEIPVQEISSRLGSAYASALEGVQEGDIVGPIEVTGTTGAPAFAVVKITAYRDRGQYGLDEVRERIRGYLTQEKQYRRFLSRLQDEIYVKILI